ncbi:SGNH/GDSL hydrolase family protein [Bacillus sp. V33-4]|uniref:SGNH/GDSL hydrolase family protein n=1 Tax=Bacillus sp. V33-4 TaxID=2054169 RepID=UPI000C767FEE|nr:SGNH/GDSL hydrolase family protein [Bacillus sp. V33-4]PLR85424.1 hypothetical protein CVD23_08590 [Bacillus sp. V33-4]
MKAIFTTILAICCAVILIMGQIYWNEKTTVPGNNQAGAVPSRVEKAAPPVKNKSKRSNSDYINLAGNWPEASQERFKTTLAEKQPFKILFAGSEALSLEDNGWPILVKEKIEAAYGKTVTVHSIQYGLNSIDFINQESQAEIAAEKADMVIFEPFTLLDNGVVELNQSLQNISTIIADIQAANEHTVIVLQPPHPLYAARYYPVQVEELKKYAAQNGITYLDHWAAWPDQQSEDLKQYLSEDQSRPNEKGHEVWAGFIEDFLIKN